MGKILRPDLARVIFEVGVVKFGTFRLKLHETRPEAPLSPIYFSFRRLPDGPLTDGLIEELGAILWRMTEDAGLIYGSVVGAPRAGEPLANVVSRLARVPQHFLWKEERGGQRAVVAPPDAVFPLRPVLLVDDSVTAAGTKLESVGAIRSAGGTVRDIVVLVDREQGGREALERAGLRLHAAWRFSQLLKFYCESGLITADKYAEATAYLQENR